MSVNGSPALRRRELLRRGFWTGIGILAAGGLAAAADFVAPRGLQRFGSVVTVPAERVPRPGREPYHEEGGRFWVVNLKRGEGVPEQFRSIASPSQNGGLLALYQKCPHLGATVLWPSAYLFATAWGTGEGGWFRCPSHGATFTKAGVRVFGPAPRSMDTFAIVGVDEGGVRVDTGRIHLGTADDPQRAVPAGPFAHERLGNLR